MIDRRFVGRRFPSRTITVRQVQVAQFCEAIGETNPIYIDEGAAHAAGLRASPTPPTFGFCLKASLGQPFDYLSDMGVDTARLLHGSQEFESCAPLYVGDVIHVSTEITAIDEKGGGRFDAVKAVTALTDQSGELRVRLISVWLVTRDARHDL
jgi:acyl dehydratase